jgi:Cep192 domain 4
MLLNRFLLGASGILLACGAYTTAMAEPHASEARGNSAGSQQVTVFNQWDKPLTDIRIEIGGSNAHDFSQTNNCGERLGVGKTCVVKVTFAPRHVGPSAATMTILTSGGSAMVNLNGTGVGTSVATAGSKGKKEED